MDFSRNFSTASVVDVLGQLNSAHQDENCAGTDKDSEYLDSASSQPINFDRRA